MIALDKQIVQAWREAAVDLGIRVVAPCDLVLADGRVVQVEAYLPDFGSPTGAVAVSLERAGNTQGTSGYWRSMLAEIYQHYDRQLFIDTLDDWQWFGKKGEEPDWYTGVTWMEQPNRDAAAHQLTIDGTRITSLDSFFAEIDRVLISGTEWGRNLDAFNDILRGGFGTPPKGFTLRWLNSSISQTALGYQETVRQLERKLETSHPGNRESLRQQIMFARNGLGPTLFDRLVEIIRDHGPEGEQARSNVRLVLE